MLTFLLLLVFAWLDSDTDLKSMGGYLAARRELGDGALAPMSACPHVLPTFNHIKLDVVN